LIFRAQRQAPVLQKLAQVRAELDRNCRSAAAAAPASTNTRLATSPGPPKRCGTRTGRFVESTDGLTLVLKECERRMSADGIPESLEFPVDAPLAQGRLEGGRIEEDVDVL